MQIDWLHWTLMGLFAMAQAASWFFWRAGYGFKHLYISKVIELNTLKNQLADKCRHGNTALDGTTRCSCFNQPFLHGEGCNCYACGMQRSLARYNRANGGLG
jgi:hypothetical protein